MKTILKKTLSVAIMVSMIISLFAVPTMAAQPELPDWEILEEPVYEMGFEPDSDGKFYDLPAGFEGRQEVPTEANPEGILLGGNNADDKVISVGKTLNSGTNETKIASYYAQSNMYSAYSKGTAANDINTGASGSVDDYCIKLTDANASGGPGLVKIDFPKAYGATDDSYNKYRIEFDWKWQAYYSNDGVLTPTAQPSASGATLLRFYIGDKQLNLKSKSSSEATDARGPGALYFVDAFGMYGSNQTTDAADVDKITETAAQIPESDSGKWIHVTVDFDFKNGTIYLVMDGETTTTQMSTTIVNGNADFAKGITSIAILGSTSAERRVNYADNVKVTPISRPDIALSQGERMGKTAYEMTFSPDSDGKFYDSPLGADGRKEIVRVDNAADIILGTNDNGNVDNKVISTDTAGRLYANLATKYNYTAISQGQSNGDFNTGASGKVDDYCLKQVDMAYNTNDDGSYAQTTIMFPETYGGTSDNTHKYRFEVDWKWQSYRTSGGVYILDTTEEPQSIKGSNIIKFYIGDKEVNLRGDYTTGNLFFYEADSSSGTTFGFTPSGQKANVADLTGILTAAPRFSEAEQGKWIHITVDFDFENGTIDATLEGENEKGTISTSILKGADEFKKGIKGIKLQGSAKNKRKANFIDNVKVSPVMTKEPAIKADGNKLMWKAVAGAASYNVYVAQTADGAKQAATVKKLDTTSNPGYVIATLDFADDSAKYYTVTATSANKGESYHSNSVSVTPKNIISNVDFEITSAADGKSTAKASVNVEAAKGFDKKIKLMAAVYDSKELIALSESPLTEFSRGADGNLELTLNNLTTIPTSEMSIKFFIWDEEITPVKASENLTFTQWREKLENSGHD